MTSGDYGQMRSALDSMYLSEDEFLTFVSQCVVATERTLRDGPCSSLTPVVAVLHQPKPHAERCCSIFGIAGDFNDHDAKHATLRAIGVGLLAQKQFPVAVCLCSEAWLASVEKSDFDPSLPPRDQPGREEVVIVAASTLQNRRLAQTYMPVTRDGADNIVPSAFTEVMSGSSTAEEGLRFPILDSFWEGWEEAARAHLKEHFGDAPHFGRHRPSVN